MQSMRRLALTVTRGRGVALVASAPAGEASRARVFAGAFAGAAAAGLAGSALLRSNLTSADEGDKWCLADLDRRIRELEVAHAEGTSSAFVFIKPHAVTDKVKQLVAERFAEMGIGIRSEGSIPSSKIDKEQLIDFHYGAIAARAMKQKPSELTVQQGAKDGFKKTFGLEWQAAVDQGQVYNLVDAAAKLGCSLEDFGGKWGKLKKDVDLLKFGGGFYCGKVEGIYVINGFYAAMRQQFTVPGECIYFYEVNWDPNRLCWGDFRGKVLGGTDPKTADAGSLRNQIFKKWKDLDLTAEPNTGNNGMHASASPFEALAERSNWLNMPIEKDYFGKAMISLGIPLDTIKAWSQDPAVAYNGKKQSLFDLMEDLDGSVILKKSVDILTGGKK